MVQLIETVITSWTQMYSDKCRNQAQVQLIETVITSWTQMYSDKCNQNPEPNGAVNRDSDNQLNPDVQW